MLGTFDGLNVTTHESISDIPPAVWDALTGTEQPYVSHAHFSALEHSGLISPDAGFLPQYLLAMDSNEKAVAAVPVFLKSTSAGELGLDLGLPIAQQRMGGAYYPKLQIEVPFTPTEGPRLMVEGSKDPDKTRQILVRSLKSLAERENAGSIQIANLPQTDLKAFQAQGYLTTETNNFIWRSAGEPDFDSWVSGMHKKGRRRVRLEFDAVLASGVTIRTLSTDDITDDTAANIFRLYQATFERHQTETWLNNRFFDQVFATMPDSIELHFAFENGKFLGGFFCWSSSTVIYAQHWLQDTPRQDIFFACMYRAISEAIRRNITAIDFGPLGEHKCYRGAGPEAAQHAFLFRDNEFHKFAVGVMAKRTEAARIKRTEMKKRLPFLSNEVK